MTRFLRKMAQSRRIRRSLGILWRVEKVAMYILHVLLVLFTTLATDIFLPIFDVFLVSLQTMCESSLKPTRIQKDQTYRCLSSSFMCCCCSFTFFRRISSLFIN